MDGEGGLLSKPGGTLPSTCQMEPMMHIYILYIYMHISYE